MGRVQEWDGDEDFSNQWALQAQATERALRGKRGRAVLRELEAALLAMPQPRLALGTLVADGEVCALGALAVHRARKPGQTFEEALAELDVEISPDRERYEDSFDGVDTAAARLRLTTGLAFAVVYQNDDSRGRTPERRYESVLAWVRERLEEPELKASKKVPR